MALFGLIWSYHFWDQLSLLSDLYVHTVSTPPKVLPSRQCQNFAAIDKDHDVDDDTDLVDGKPRPAREELASRTFSKNTENQYQ